MSRQTLKARAMLLVVLVAAMIACGCDWKRRQATVDAGPEAATDAGAAPAPHPPLGADYPEIPNPGDAGTVLTSNGQGVMPGWLPAASITNPSNPTTLPYFSPVTTLEAINATGDNVGGASFGHFFGSNNGGTANKYTFGVSFYVTAPSHTCTGARFWWAGDATHETATTVTCDLWDAHSASPTSVASGTSSVTYNAEFSCFFGAYTMTAGRPYVISINDTGPCTSPGGCALGATYFNSSNASNVAGMLYCNTDTEIIASPWLIFGPLSTGAGTNVQNWPSLQSPSPGHAFPSSSSTECSAVEPIVQ